MNADVWVVVLAVTGGLVAMVLVVVAAMGRQRDVRSPQRPRAKAAPAPATALDVSLPRPADPAPSR